MRSVLCYYLSCLPVDFFISSTLKFIIIIIIIFAVDINNDDGKQDLL